MPRPRVEWFASAFTAAFAAMVMAKVLCMVDLLATDFGRARVFAGPAGVAQLALLWEDVAVALVWAGVVTAILSVTRASRNDVSRATVTAVIAIGFVLGVSLTACVTVYRLLGTPPTLGLFMQLLHAGDSTDSMAELITGATLATGVVLCCLLGAGPFLLTRVVSAIPRRWLRLAPAGFVVATAGAAAIAPPNPAELDRNGIYEFARSALMAGNDGIAESGGTFADTLQPVAPRAPLRIPRLGYRDLKEWASSSRRNVVVVILEGAAARHLQLTGGAYENTPTLQRFAERGILWPRHFAHAPNSMFAIYSILCGNHGGPESKQITFHNPRVDCRSMSEVLLLRGYRSALFHSGYFHSHRKDRFLSGRGYEVLHDTSSLNFGKKPTTSWGVEESITIDRMLAWIEQQQGPFFATYIPVYTHHPYRVPDSRYRKFSHPKSRTLTNYINSFYYMDSMLERLESGLRQAGHADDTLFVIVGDHGEAFEEHPNSKVHGSNLYQENVLSFALWYAPGGLDRGYVDHRPMGHVDIAPTLFSLLGIELQSEHPGIPATDFRARPLVPLYTAQGRTLTGFVNGTYKYIYNRKTRAHELYDLVNDPTEQTSVHDGHPAWLPLYEARAKEFKSSQAAWERQLGVVEAQDTAPSAGQRRTMYFDLSTCDARLRRLASDDGFSLARGKYPFTCILDIPTPIWVSSIALVGSDAADGTRVQLSLSHVNRDAVRREVAYCALDGNPGRRQDNCTATLVSGRRNMPAGRLEANMRVDFRHDELSPDKFALRALRVEYVGAGED